jgi:5-hydroxyisourate hydrolase-like protein (transthyretin family)
MWRQIERTLLILLGIGVAVIPIRSQAQQAARGRIEGVVVKAGSNPPQPVVGARITVTKVNAATGANVPVSGRASSVLVMPAGVTPFPGLPAWTVQVPPGLAGALSSIQEAAPPIPSVTTDRSGRFLVPDLDEGAYRLLVTQNGYVRQEYSQRVFPGQGTLISLAVGQAFKDITIRLTEAGNAGGRIVDDSGLPAAGVPLQLLKASYNQTGQRILQQAGTARTNDRGEYRFYWMTPGRYYVAGGNAAANYTFQGFGGMNPNEPAESYMLTYYPGVTDISRATAIDIQSGSEAVLDFVVPKQQLFTVSGKVVNPAPASASGTLPAVTVSLAFQTLTGFNGAFFPQPQQQDYDPATGIFVLRDVLPGSYMLQAAASGFSARMPVEVTNSNVENLVVTVNSGVSITGRFITDSGNLPPANTLQVQMRLTSNDLQNYMGTAPGSPNAAADGSFSIPGVLPGEYRIVANSSQDFYVKELRYNRLDALTNPVSVCCNSDSATIEVVISRNVGQIDGVIVDDRMQPVPGVQAVLIPDARQRTELFKTATTDQTGRFVMPGLTPGDYKLFAWEGLENYGYFDPEVMRRAEALGKPVHVGESSKLAVEGKTIPAGN